MCVAARSCVKQASLQHLSSVAWQIELEGEDQLSFKGCASPVRLKRAGAGNEWHGMFAWLPPHSANETASQLHMLFWLLLLLLEWTSTVGVDTNSAVLSQTSFFFQSLDLPLLSPHHPGLL